MKDKIIKEIQLAGHSNNVDPDALESIIENVSILYDSIVYLSHPVDEVRVSQLRDGSIRGTFSFRDQDNALLAGKLVACRSVPLDLMLAYESQEDIP